MNSLYTVCTCTCCKCRSTHLSVLVMGARRNFSRGGNTAWTDKKDLFFGAPRCKRKLLRFFRRFRLNLRVFDASAEGASENFKVFNTRTAYDVIIFEIPVGGNCPRLPPPPRAYDHGFAGAWCSCWYNCRGCINSKMPTHWLVNNFRFQAA